MRFFAVALFFCGAASYAQTPEVPQKMGFAGMTLTLRDDVRREIQADVDKLHQHKGYYTMKVERARTYFPIIERVFKEEGVPEDFKYLVLQESALVADAVSVSNAVGFWQFKDFTALEMGLRVDKDIDERMNLVSSTRAAANYLKKSNKVFDNWLLSLQSYQMGAGGVRRSMGDTQFGAKNIEVTTETYWYVKKFLAHKVAFENSLEGEAMTKVIAYESRSKKTLKEIADDVSAQESDLKDYNKWVKGESIPTDKVYTVLIPIGKLDADFTKLILASNKASKAVPLPAKAILPSTARQSINSIPALIALPGETTVALAQRGAIDLSDFLKFNDIGIDHIPQGGDVYLLSKKKTRGDEETYKVKAGDDLWSVSQQVGVRMKNLKKFNRLSGESLEVGTLVWLKGDKPDGEVLLLDQGEVVTLEDESFDWYMKTPKEEEAVTISSLPVEELPVQPAKESVVPVGNTETATSHTVKAGDTFYSIAHQYGVGVTDLLNWNNLTIQGGLKPGQILKVVDNEPIKNETEVVTPPQLVLVTHEVKPSDTLYSIARQYGVTIKDIMEWNHKTDFSLSRGEKLEIRKGSH